jgi:hypothetical protein
MLFSTVSDIDKNKALIAIAKKLIIKSKNNPEIKKTLMQQKSKNKSALQTALSD